MNNGIQIQFSLYLGLSVGLLILPIPWLLAWLAAAFVHEIGHVVVLKLLQVPIYRITVNINGAYMETGYLSPCDECLCALAGPLAGLLCLIFSQPFPLVAFCGFVQSIYNLLPYPSYDGGRVLCVVLNEFLSSNTAFRIYRWIIMVFSCVLILLGLYFCFRLKLGYVALLICLIPVFKSGIIKIPCKQR